MTDLHTAFEFFQQNKLEEARTLLENVVKTEPEESQAYYLLGLVAMQSEDEDDAIDLFKKTVELSPEATPAHYNLGVLHYNRGHFDVAQHHYNTALQLAPEDPDIHFSLALTCKQLGNPSKAKEHFEIFLESNPTDTDGLYNLANTEQQLDNNNKAISLLETILKTEPEHLSALNNLGYLYHKEGKSEKAIPVYQTLIKNNHNAVAAEHLLASLTGKTTSHAPTSYVKDVFDQFADHFDKSLQQNLGYNTPTLLRNLLDENLPQSHFSHGLDLGCGTGLSGETFTGCTAELTGIDLSPNMLKQAQTKKLYNALHESDLVPFIQNSPVDYDLYIAADVFVYIGDLSPIFTAIASKKGIKTFIFSTEHGTADYVLKPTGRYGHSQEYIKKLAKENGFSIITHGSAPIRKEGSKWIDGELYILTA